MGLKDKNLSPFKHESGDAQPTSAAAPHDWHGRTSDGIWRGCPKHPDPMSASLEEWREVGRREGLEQAAKICESRVVDAYRYGNREAEQCAIAIREAAAPSADLLGEREALKWALGHVEFPLVPDPLDSEHSWKGCPGCRTVWERDMQHKDDCVYVKALGLIYITP